MKNKKLCIYSFLAIGLLLMLLNACDKNENIDNNDNDTTLIDIDGNIYQIIAIGTQTWMTENLKVTHYRDGDPIFNITDNEEWKDLTTPAYCWHRNNEAASKNLYGALYNWQTISTEKLCPSGWHVPSDNEWTTLTNYLTNNNYGHEGEGDDIAKALADTSGWTTSDVLGTIGNDPAGNNSSGFTALPGGYRNSDGTFSDVGYWGAWWTSTEYNTDDSYSRYLGYDTSNIVNAYIKKSYGFSVRCVRDE